MTASPWHPSLGPDAAPDANAAGSGDVPGDDLLSERVIALSARTADCCVAPAAYRVVVPANSARPHPTQLLLCAHHYRASTEGLLLARAAVHDASDRLIVSSV
jgi:hypothetical protein